RKATVSCKQLIDKDFSASTCRSAGPERPITDQARDSKNARTARNRPDLGRGSGELRAEGLAGDTEDLRGLALVAVHLTQHFENVGFFDCFERAGLARHLLGQGPVGGAGEGQRKLVRLDRVGGAEDDETLD